jgi:hypothetical protein
MDDTTREERLARLDARLETQTDILGLLGQNMVRLGEVQELTRQVLDTHLTRLGEILAAMAAQAARQDAILDHIVTHQARHDEILARMDEHTAQIAQILARFDQGRNGR